MQAFVRWLGFAAAIGAAVLGAVWLLEAMPPGDEALRLARDACLRTVPGGPGDLRFALERAACWNMRPAWNEALALRGLVALAVGVALALMAARLPAPDGPARRDAAREVEALRILVEDEKRRARVHQNVELTEKEAEYRARRRLRGETTG
jgi:hypothetical protein